MTIALWPTAATAPDLNDHTAGATVANDWHVTSDDLASVGLSWYRKTTSTPAPLRLRLYDAVSQAVLASVAPSDNGLVGWQDANLATQVALIANHAYTVTATYPTGADIGYSASARTPDSGLVWERGRFGSGGTTPPYPASTSTNEYNPSVIVDTATPGTPPATPVDVSNQLAAWLSTTDGTHGDSAPLEDHTTLATMSAVVGSTAGQLDATKAVSDTIHDLLTATNKNLGTLWDLAGHLTDLELAAYKALFGAGSARLTGPNSAGGSAFYTADGNLVSQLVAETWQRVRVLRGDIGFGTDGWSMSASADFEDAIAFAEPADAYVVSITSYQDTQPATESPAGLWLYRLGWWCVLTGALASRREFVEFQQQLLSDEGRRMPGCAIQLKPGTLATVQAWLLA